MANQLEFTVGGLLDHIAGRFPENDALVYDGGDETGDGRGYSQEGRGDDRG